jgi:hypothetical protein
LSDDEQLPFDGELSISKEVLPSIDESRFEPTNLGDPRGAIRQYRSASGVHIREYDDHFVVHIDRIDPRTDPFGHLLVDSPESILAFGAASLLASPLKRKTSEEDSSSGSFLAPFSFFLTFFSLNRIFRIFKRLLFG